MVQERPQGLMLDREPEVALRDPAAFYHDGVYRCFHTAVETRGDRYHLSLDVTQSRDLLSWTPPRRLASGDLNFSSPGNVVRFRDRWVLCLQSYPVPPGAEYGDESARLWLMESRDLEAWSAPRPLRAEGCTADWTASRRQIDPYLVAFEDRYWCLYKTAGQLGMLVSEDLDHWEEALPDRPAFGVAQTPDGSTIENPCVVRDGEEWVLFFSPCRPGRGIGVARSTDLLNWREARHLDFPPLSWAPGGVTAAMVLDTRAQSGRWTMFFHGDREGAHGAALGIAFSGDLDRWELGAPRLRLEPGRR